jgi:type IV pilus assembly protein PilE
MKKLKNHILIMRSQKQRGFTLLELMIAVVIVGILTAIAVPQYGAYMTQGKIPEATSTLSTLRVKLEQYYQDNRTYVGACATGTSAPIPVTPNFTYSCPTLTSTAFIARATGTGSMTGFTFEVDQSGSQTTTALPSGWGTAPLSCWITKKGGTC